MKNTVYKDTRIFRKICLNLSYNEIISILFQLYLAITLYGRGLFFMSASSSEVKNSTWYAKIDNIADITVVGAFTVMAATLILVATWSKSKRGLILSMVGHAIAIGLYVFLSTTGVTEGMNWYTPFTNLTHATFHFFVLLAGGFILWSIRIRKPM